MKSLHQITLTIAEAARAVLDESAFDDAALKWQGQADEKDIKSAIDSFKQLKARSMLKGAEADISPWTKKPFKDFSTFVGSKSEVLQKKDVSKKIEKDVKHIFENDLVTIISPNTFEASKKYGAGTKWCISGKDKLHWDDYIEKDVKFYFILPKANKNKLAFAIYPNGTVKEVYDAEDNIISKKVYEPLLKAYKIPSNIIKVIYSNKDKTNWDEWLKNIERVVPVIKNEDGTIDVKGDVDLSSRHLIKIPFKFRTVTGNFYVHNNELTSLTGAPVSVGGKFLCNYNQLKSLEGAPVSVGGDFYCSRNKLKSLVGAPKSVGGDFICNDNRLTSLEGAPSKIDGDFYCGSNFVRFTKEQVKEVSKVRGEIYVNRFY
jgi:hypothetical protein